MAFLLLLPAAYFCHEVEDGKCGDFSNKVPHIIHTLRSEMRERNATRKKKRKKYKKLYTYDTQRRKNSPPEKNSTQSPVKRKGKMINDMLI